MYFVEQTAPGTPPSYGFSSVLLTKGLWRSCTKFEVQQLRHDAQRAGDAHVQAVGAGLDVCVHPVVQRLEVEHSHRRGVPRKVHASHRVTLTKLAPLERELGRRRVRRQPLEWPRAAAAWRAGRPYELQARPLSCGVCHLA